MTLLPNGRERATFGHTGIDMNEFDDEDPLPPETTTPMPPMLRLVAPRLFPKPPPPKPHITPKTLSRWPSFVAKMSPPTDSVQP